MKFFIALLLSMALWGCSPNAEEIKIKQLESQLEEQKGTQAANLAFAEREAGIYEGCILWFNVCPDSTLQQGKRRIADGFAGGSSPWFWLAVIGKASAIAGFLGVLFWFPWHLNILFTEPAKAVIDAAKNQIAQAQAKADTVQKRIYESEQLVKIAEEKAHHLDNMNAERYEKLAAVDKALKAKELELTAAEKKLENLRILQATFKKV